MSEGKKFDAEVVRTSAHWARVWDEGWAAHRHEHVKQQRDPSYPITRTNPYLPSEVNGGLGPDPNGADDAPNKPKGAAANTGPASLGMPSATERHEGFIAQYRDYSGDWCEWPDDGVVCWTAKEARDRCAAWLADLGYSGVGIRVLGITTSRTVEVVESAS